MGVAEVQYESERNKVKKDIENNLNTMERIQLK